MSIVHAPPVQHVSQHIRLHWFAKCRNHKLWTWANQCLPCGVPLSCVSAHLQFRDGPLKWQHEELSESIKITLKLWRRHTEYTVALLGKVLHFKIHPLTNCKDCSNVQHYSHTDPYCCTYWPVINTSGTTQLNWVSSFTHCMTSSYHVKYMQPIQLFLY